MVVPNLIFSKRFLDCGTKHVLPNGFKRYSMLFNIGPQYYPNTIVKVHILFFTLNFTHIYLCNLCLSAWTPRPPKLITSIIYSSKHIYYMIFLMRGYFFLLIILYCYVINAMNSWQKESAIRDHTYTNRLLCWMTL